MEVSIFPKFSELMDRYVEVRLDTDPTDSHSDDSKAYQETLTGESQTRPTYIIVDPKEPEKVIDSYVGADLPSGKAFAEFLRRNSGS